MQYMEFDKALYIKIFERNLLLGIDLDKTEHIEQYRYKDQYQFMLYCPENGNRTIWQQDKVPDIDSLINGMTEHIIQLWAAYGESTIERVNSNIYKRVFPSAIDMEYMTHLKKEERHDIITQQSHGFSKGQFVFRNASGIYELSCADNISRAIVDGIVAEIKDDDTFVLQRSGNYPFRNLGWEETLIIYLSDTVPGDIKHYQSIQTQIYTPVAISIGDTLIICPQQTSNGIGIREYDNESWMFDSYTGQELLEAAGNVFDYYKEHAHGQ